METGKVNAVGDSDFDQEVLKGEGLAVVFFTAAWCGPCRQMAPFVNDLASKYASKVRFFSVDVDASQRVGGTYAISSLPTLLFFKKGEKVSEMVGPRLITDVGVEISRLM